MGWCYKYEEGDIRLMTTTTSFNDYMTMDKSTTDLTNKGKCTNCGGCCSNMLPVTTTEIDRIKEYVKENNIKIVTNNSPILNTVDSTCPFRSNKLNKCLVYVVRPLICREYKCDTGAVATKKWSKEITKHPRTSTFMRSEDWT
jgi:Fe-S-cluster containining protein